MMTKSEVAAQYRLTDRGTVASPGKFEGEPWYAVALWDLVLDGGADMEHDGNPCVSYFFVDASFVLSIVGADNAARDEFAERFEPGTYLGIWERSDGFVCLTDRGLTSDEIESGDWRLTNMGNKKANKGRKAHRVETITRETAGVSISVTPEDEIEGPEGFFDSGEPEADRAMIAEMMQRLRGGDIWAWFCAKVSVSYDGLTSDQYLGACSYTDEADFRAGGYFDDMVSEAIDDLNKQIAKRDHFATCEHCKAVTAGTLPAPTHA